MSQPPFARVSFASPTVHTRPTPGGGMTLSSPQKLQPYSRCLGELLEHWAQEMPDRTFLAEPLGDGWRRLSYRDALSSVRSVGQALLDRNLSPERPVAVLSDAGIDHGIVALAAMHVGVTVAPISPAYSLVSQDFGKLKYIFELLQPGLIYAAQGTAFARAIATTAAPGAEFVCSYDEPANMRATPFSGLLATRPTRAVDLAFASVGPNTVGKILFTSGSTDLPKGVINTQRMMCCNQQQIAQVWHFLSERPPVLVDWLPWNHTFGGNHNFNLTLRHGGTMYIDDGKPTGKLIGRTAANLKQFSPTIYFNVPRGYDMLLPYLEQDEQLRNNFFRELDLMFYAGAGLPQNLWERLEAVSVAVRGERVPMVSSWGATETAPSVTMVHYPIERAGNIGLPLPGCEVKMVPNADKMELRVRGPNVTPGYWKRDDLTQKAFDEDGFYAMGDAGRLEDPASPSKGLVFDGRVVEDFKLLSGTWVQVSGLRVKAIAAGEPVIQDVVVTGHDQEDVGLLVFLSEAACRRMCPELPTEASLSALSVDPRVRSRVAGALTKLVAESTGSSNRPTRALILDEPPSIDANEITDKGYINQRAVLTRRSSSVARLYAKVLHPQVILPPQGVFE